MHACDGAVFLSSLEQCQYPGCDNALLVYQAVTGENWVKGMLASSMRFPISTYEYAIISKSSLIFKKSFMHTK